MERRCEFTPAGADEHPLARDRVGNGTVVMDEGGVKGHAIHVEGHRGELDAEGEVMPLTVAHLQGPLMHYKKWILDWQHRSTLFFYSGHLRYCTKKSHWPWKVFMPKDRSIKINPFAMANRTDITWNYLSQIFLLKMFCLWCFSRFSKKKKRKKNWQRPENYQRNWLSYRGLMGRGTTSHALCAQSCGSQKRDCTMH